MLFLKFLQANKTRIMVVRNCPECLLFLMAFAMSFCFAGWMAVLNNFVIEGAGFTGKEIGILQSLREIPGFLAVTVILWLTFFKEQSFALFNLTLLGGGVFITGFFPYAHGLYLTTMVMSTGFHYFETVNSSLTLQWIPKNKTPETIGRQLSIKSMGAILAFLTIWGMAFFFDYIVIYIVLGGVTMALSFFCWKFWPHFPEKTKQHKYIILRARYSLYYTLDFMSGARRQIFVVFAAFMMVEKFHFSASAIAMIFLLNNLVNIKLAPLFGRLVSRWGERNSLCLEYVGLFFVFVGYAFVESPIVAVGLYIIDHMFFALGIALKSYFQKIAAPEDIAASAAVSFSINHIAAVFLPFSLGILWLTSPSYVFFIGAGIALISLLISLCIPRNPAPGNEFTLPIKMPSLRIVKG